MNSGKWGLPRYESLKASQIPGATKVGLAREEFISAWINLHPKFAIVSDYYRNGDGWIAPSVEELYQGQKSLKEEWIHKLELGIAMETSSFYPREVILRTSDFKTNEYESLVGAIYYQLRCPVHGTGIGLKRLERCPECGSPVDSYEVRIEPKESNPQAKQILETAHVQRKLTPRSALNSCDEVLERFPDSLEADEAKLMIKSILRSPRGRVLKKEREQKGKYIGS